MNVLIWGIGNEFHQLYHLLTINEIAGNFQIVGYVSKDRTKKQLDGKDVLVPEEIVNSRVAFDYIIVTTNIYFKEIVDYGNDILQIERKNLLMEKYLKYHILVGINICTYTIVTSVLLQRIVLVECFLTLWDYHFVLHL